jgi:hypothetical protein
MCGASRNGRFSQSGTEGSNPPSSTGESLANLTSLESGRRKFQRAKGSVSNVSCPGRCSCPILRH